MNIELKNISEEQFGVILKALDFYSRILSGQTSEINWVYTNNGISPENPLTTDEASKTIAKNHFGRDINGYNSHLGIAESCTNAKRAYDLYKELRYKSGKEGDHSVYKYKPSRLLDTKFQIEFKND